MGAIYIPTPLENAALQARLRNTALNDGCIINRPVVATRGTLCNEYGDTNLTGRTFRIAYKAVGTTGTNVSDLQCVFANDDSSVTSQLTITAALEYPSGTFYQLKFKGSKTCVLDPGSVIKSDTVGFEIPVGGVFWIRSFVVVSSGTAFPLGGISNPYIGDSATTSTTDYSATAATGQGNSYSDLAINNTNPFWGPVAITGTTTSSKPCIVALGDSITKGGNDSPTSGESNLTGLGWFGRAMNEVMPYINIGKGGETSGSPTGSKFALRKACAANAQYVTINFGVNDGFATSVITNLATLVDAFTQRGINPILVTCFPKVSGNLTASPPSGNQTIGGTESLRVALNSAIRNRTGALSGKVYTVWDVAKYIETDGTGTLTQDGGYTMPGTSADGTHLSRVGCMTVAAGLIADGLIAALV